MSSLVIIGNGFDIHHGCESQYSDYKAWLQEHDKPLYDKLNRYIDISGNWWNNFEMNLSEFNLQKLQADVPPLVIDYNVDPRFPPSFSSRTAMLMRGLRDEIEKSFTEWIESIKIPQKASKITLPPDSDFITFNYTNTLESLYGIPEDRILHIHGKRGGKLIYGHGKSEYQIEQDVKSRFGLYESEQFLVAGTYGNDESETVMQIGFLEKIPQYQILEHLVWLSDKVHAATDAWIYGFSYAKVDMEYLEWIMEQIADNVKWHAGYHIETDKQKAKAFFEHNKSIPYDLFYF